MIRPAHRALAFLVCMAAFCGALHAQTDRTITIRMVDGRTGKLIQTQNYLVRVDHQEAIHADWAVGNEDGTGKLVVPRGTSVLSIRATYEGTTSYYDNCDSNKDQGTPVDRWYSIADILTKGIVARNDCIGKKVPDKLQFYAKPGEFVFFVRKQNWHEKFSEDYASH
jgi:hypothetical protein